MHSSMHVHTSAHLRDDALARMGAPYDVWEMTDFLDDRTPAYKLYVMVNVQWLDDQERAALTAKAAADGATVLWVGLPGVVNPDADTTYGLDHVRTLTGFEVMLDVRGRRLNW